MSDTESHEAKMEKDKDETAAITAADAAKETETDGAEEQPMETPNKKTTSKPAKSPGTPGKITYVQMVTGAIITLKDRTGSSQIAIKKYILANNPGLTPEKMKLNLNKTLKSGVKSNRFIKVKASFKIHPDFRKKMKAKQSKTAKKKPTAAELAAQREKDRKAAKEKARLDRIRKRKFPMEDTKLMAEDKELNVSVTLPPRPSLNIAFPEAASACKSDSTKSGLLEDAFHVYHFFRGDVGWGLGQKRCVAPFTLEQWLACVHQVFMGATKRSRMLPPLMNHLFVVALQNLVPEELQAALTPASWSEVLMLYMDAMDRFYETELSEKSNALVGQPIDTEYLFGVTEERKDDSLLEANTPESPYLDKTLVKAHSKLLTQDPWMLSADELLGLLRALVDDILANSAESAIELDVRLQETTELFKNKRSADANFRKLHSTRIKEQAELKTDEKERLENGVKATRSNTKSSSVSETQVESAKRTQQKAHDAYEKACKSRRIRTEPIGSDRHFNEFFHFWNDPLRVFVLQRGKAMPSSRAYKLRDLDTYKTSWCSIDKRSVLEDYMESLDVRGERESVLYQALEPACKLVHDDVKVANEKKAQLKEKLELQRKLENAKLKCEFGRKSGRLAAQSEQEFSVLQTEIDMLAKSIAGGTESRKPDLEEETGLKMLRNFDNEDKPKKRVTRRDAQNLKEEEEEDRLLRLPCSSLWSTGNIDGTGIVGSVVWELLQLEERVERLASCDNGDRKDWIANLEIAVHSWHVASPPVLEDVAKVNTPNGSKGKKQKCTDTSGSAVTVSPSGSYANSATQILTMLKQPLLALEDRVFRMTGLAMAAQDADEADDNMSASPEEDEQEQLQLVWKKLIHRLRHFPAKAHSKIRQAVVEAIAAARKAQNPVVVTALRDALLQFHPDAAGACKSAALAVLEQHGGYDDVDVDEDDAEEMEQEEPQDVKEAAGGLSLALCAEAVILRSSLDGREDATRVDWMNAVKRTKTFSRMAALTAGFCAKASEKLDKLEAEQETLNNAIEEWEKGSSSKKKKSANEDITESSEVWASVSFTDEFCLVKLGPYPWWPAKKVIANDKGLSDSLSTLGRTLVSLIGESGGLRVVKTENMNPFSEELPEDEDLSSYSKDMRSQLEDCMTTARRIVRGKEKKTSISSKMSQGFNDFKEEKKLAS